MQDRTGHTSSNMINLYRRTARTAAELGLGELLPLDEAIPELRPKKPAKGTAKPTRSTSETTSEDLPAEVSRETDPTCLALSRRGQKAVPTEGFEPS